MLCFNHVWWLRCGCCKISIITQLYYLHGDLLSASRGVRHDRGAVAAHRYELVVLRCRKFEFARCFQPAYHVRARNVVAFIGCFFLFFCCVCTCGVNPAIYKTIIISHWASTAYFDIFTIDLSLEMIEQLHQYQNNCMALVSSKKSFQQLVMLRLRT